MVKRRNNKVDVDKKVWAIVDKFGNIKEASGMLCFLEEALRHCPADYTIKRIK